VPAPFGEKRTVFRSLRSDLCSQIPSAEFKDPTELELSEVAKTLLEEWLRDPRGLAHALGIDEKTLSKLSPDELIKYFLERLKEQTEAHQGEASGLAQEGPLLWVIPDTIPEE